MTSAKRNSKLSEDRDQNLQRTSPYLHTEKEHKKWFEEHTMGKQRGKPRYDLKEKKK